MYQINTEMSIRSFQVFDFAISNLHAKLSKENLNKCISVKYNHLYLHDEIIYLDVNSKDLW